MVSNDYNYFPHNSFEIKLYLSGHAYPKVIPC